MPLRQKAANVEFSKLGTRKLAFELFHTEASEFFVSTYTRIHTENLTSQNLFLCPSRILMDHVRHSWHFVE
jgi:hypothetical protein